ncbi:hypothetical protein [Companilactobacillus jidongensis]|uniref:hypothetical protein n=1 Tax=Companilactobacillus jidongensis TaxID=2486006 RepID=UPI000F7A500F|nr:hypothetical protein [Companilactobacillus jidongensis]
MKNNMKLFLYGGALLTALATGLVTTVSAATVSPKIDTDTSIPAPAKIGDKVVDTDVNVANNAISAFNDCK